MERDREDAALAEAGWRSQAVRETERTQMLPLYAARIEDLVRGDLVKVDCAARHHIALLTPEAVLRVGLSAAAKVLDLKGRLRCRGCRRNGERSFGSSGGYRKDAGLCVNDR
jgi:hypothetical protein